MRITLLCAAILCSVSMSEAQVASWQAGAARRSITPKKAVWMTGYGSRVHASEGVATELYTRAVALKAGEGEPVVMVGVELLGLPREVGARIAVAVEKRYGMGRERLLLNSSHTHGGPAVTHAHKMLYFRATAAEVEDVNEYTQYMESQVVAAVGEALRRMGPATVGYAAGWSDIAMNRRRQASGGYVISANAGGPVDREVPILVVESRGKRVATVFGYACHNTTAGGDVYAIHGDYAGVAQSALEAKYAGSVALFIEGCGGDANPEPRGTLALAKRHGEALAGVVEKASGKAEALEGPVACAYEVFPVAFAGGLTREKLEAQLKHADVHYQWQAKELLRLMDQNGGLAAAYPYPMQVWQFGRKITLVGMSGEVVVDYALRLKKELAEGSAAAGNKVWVAGYCNDVFAYVPSQRVLREGGYEPVDSMIYYVQPGPFAPTIEETLISKARELAGRARAGVWKER